MSNFDPEAASSSSLQEEQLLPGPPPHFQNLQLRRQSVKVTRERSRNLKGPLRAARLCILSVLFPGFLVAVPLYMRFHVYGEQLYPVGMSDMRLLDNRVSTTWCQRQLVRANTTFNAFLLPEQPIVDHEPLRVAMTRHLELEDDMKEYWAFYLLQGSSVTVSTCVRWEGASLVVIRGHKHLHECAYIGDDSSEELEEMEAQITEGGHWPVVAIHDPNQIKIKTDRRSSTDGGTTNESNQPTRMRRLRPEVMFHGNRGPISSHEKLHYKDEPESEDVDNIVIQLIQNIGRAKSKLKAKDGANKVSTGSNPKVLKEATGSPKSDDVRNNTEDGSTTTTSGEVFEDILKRLQQLGDRGKGVLKKLNEQMGEVTPSTDDVVLNTLRNIVRQMLHEQVNGKSENKTRSNDESSGKLERSRRETQSPTMQDALNRNDEDEDTAIEEGFQPDEHADHHAKVNETTPNDQSKSEFWSSFSSSEEKLLNCAGLILNLPLTPHHMCDQQRSDREHTTAARENTITYKVPRNGYYFFVFSSENEVQTNYIRVHFDLEKKVYNVSNSMAACRNSTEPCSLPLDFFSSEKVVLELPVRSNESLWNEEFIAVSTCEPRTALYLGCVIAVPLFILLFAFQ